METSKSKRMIYLAAMACIGCCAIPIYALVIGATSIGFGVLIIEPIREIIACLLPVLIFGIGYYLYQKQRQKKRCCVTPQKNCITSQCATKPPQNE